MIHLGVPKNFAAPDIDDSRNSGIVRALLALVAEHKPREGKEGREGESQEQEDKKGRR